MLDESTPTKIGRISINPEGSLVHETVNLIAGEAFSDASNGLPPVQSPPALTCRARLGPRTLFNPNINVSGRAYSEHEKKVKTNNAVGRFGRIKRGTLLTNAGANH
jgi:hypothetical protein